MFADAKETGPSIVRPTCTIPIMLMIKLIALRMTRTSVTVRTLTSRSKSIMMLSHYANKVGDGVVEAGGR